MVASEREKKRGFCCEKFKRTLSWKNTMGVESAIETAEFAVLNYDYSMARFERETLWIEARD